VVKALAEKGAEPVAFDVVPPPAGWLPAGVPFVRGTMANLEEVTAAIADHKVKRVVALGYIMAPLMSPQYRDFVGAVKANCLGITHIFEAARLLGVDRVVFASTAGVYGPQSQYGERPVTEDDPINASGAYSTMKVVNETMAQMYSRAYGMQIVRVRPPGIMGAGNTMWTTRLITPPAVGRPAKINFPSKRRQNAVPVEDLAELYCQMALAPKVAHDLYLAPGHAFPTSQVADIVRGYIPDAKIEFDETVTPVEAGFPYLYDSTRVTRDFPNWKLHPLEQAVLSHINGDRTAAGLKPL
jgi:UDP-glucose 4-epimerase